MVNVFLTIDTECSMAGALDDDQKRRVDPEKAILGRIGNEYYGTPLIMTILERRGLRGTFFVEVLASRVVDRQKLADAYGAIVARGHDVQLHLHPVYYYYDLLRQKLIRREEIPAQPDLIGTLPDSVQLDLLQEGVQSLRALTGVSPVAFRAGSFGASRRTLSCLARVGIEYDTSFNSIALGKTCFLDSRPPTNLAWREAGVWEVPLTNFEGGVGRFRGLKPLNVASVSYAEMERVLESAEQCGLQNVVFILHSFAFLKRKDVQFRHMRPDRVVVKRFEALCEFLSANFRRFQVMTFGSRPQLENSSAENRLPNLGWYLPAVRKMSQAVNRIYWT
jgi:hypothetical protein